MLYAAVEIQNPHGIRGYILTLLKGRNVAQMEKMTCRQGMADTSQAWIYYKESGHRHSHLNAARKRGDAPDL